MPGEKYNWPSIAVLLVEMLWKVPIEEIKSADGMKLEKNQLALVSGVYSSSNYASIYHLAVEKDFTAQEIFEATTTAVCVVKFLQRADYFGAETPKDDILLVGATAIRHMLNLAFHISSVRYGVKKLHTEPSHESMPGATVPDVITVHAASSLLNHSCYPNCMTVVYGDKTIVRASRHIRKGEEICGNYGRLRFETHDLSERKDVLNSKKFECKCEACTDDWPTRFFMKHKIVVKCPNCGSKFSILRQSESIPSSCESCSTSTSDLKVNKKTSLVDLIANIEKTVQDIQNLKPHSKPTAETVKKTRHYVEFLAKHLVPPCTYLTMAEDLLCRVLI